MADTRKAKVLIQIVEVKFVQVLGEVGAGERGTESGRFRSAVLGGLGESGKCGRGFGRVCRREC